MCIRFLGIFTSLPLSLIQKDRSIKEDDNESIEDQTQITQWLDANISIEFINELDDDSGQLVPSIKFEDVASPPYSPARSPGCSSPNDKVSRAQLASKLLSDLDNLKQGKDCYHCFWFYFCFCNVFISLDFNQSEILQSF